MELDRGLRSRYSDWVTVWPSLWRDWGKWCTWIWVRTVGLLLSIWIQNWRNTNQKCRSVDHDHQDLDTTTELSFQDFALFACLMGRWTTAERKSKNRRLPPRLKLIFPSSGFLRGVRWFDTDVSELRIGLPFFFLASPFLCLFFSSSLLYGLPLGFFLVFLFSVPSTSQTVGDFTSLGHFNSEQPRGTGRTSPLQALHALLTLLASLALSGYLFPHTPCPYNHAPQFLGLLGQLDPWRWDK